MATVFLARDLKHDRPVALKVLHQELAAVLGAERFQREIRLAARLQHPHILTVHDSGETAAQLWFTMPYVEGESLRDRLRREKQLSVEDAVRITREAALALEYAHQQGVIHRDIKPENILLTRDGSTLVADFGIARAIAAPGEQLTQTGMAVGTPAYMSPEQATGDRDLDARSDVYALGCVLYEMLAGEPAFTGPTPQAVLLRAMTERPRALNSSRAGVPHALDAVISRAMALTPADRFPSMAAFAQGLSAVMQPTVGTAAPAPQALQGAEPSPPPRPPSHRPMLSRRPLFAMLALGMLIGVGVLFAWRRGQGSGSQAEGAVKRLAVLPFENLGDSADGYFADGMTDEIRGKLAMLPGLQVIATSSVSQYRGTHKSPEEIARELEVGYLLVGKVRWERIGGQGRVRVSPELIELSRGAPTIRWQQPFDAPLTDLFQMQGDIAERVVQSLNVAIAPAQERQLASRPTANVAAYDAYLQANALLGTGGGTPSGNIRPAITLLERAVALDSGFAAAWAQLSRAHSVANFLLLANPQDSAAAESAARRALALNPREPLGYLALGDFFGSVAKDPVRALEQYSAGGEVAPQNAELLTQGALSQMTLGRWEEALASLQNAERLDPRSLATVRRLSYTLARLRRFDSADEAADRALAIAPASLEAIHNKIVVRLMQGDLEGARQVLDRAASQVDPTALVAYVATYFDLYWLPVGRHQELLLRLPPSAFGGVRSDWALAMAETWDYRGDHGRARAYADTASGEYERQLKAAPNDPSATALLGMALAYAGRKTEAIQMGQRAVTLLPIARDHFSGPYFAHLLARIYVKTGESGKAIELLGELLRSPYILSPGWLRIDPNFDPIRNDQRFQKLTADNP
jgi:TolB-like protein/tetratricopeptide (TPR) repeat protein